MRTASTCPLVASARPPINRNNVDCMTEFTVTSTPEEVSSNKQHAARKCNCAWQLLAGISAERLHV